MLIWKEKDSIKYGDFPDQSQSFRFFACSLAPKQTILSRLEKHAWYIVIKLEIFQRGYVMILAKNMKLFKSLFYTLKHISKMFGDVLRRKQSFLDLKIMHII